MKSISSSLELEHSSQSLYNVTKNMQWRNLVERIVCVHVHTWPQTHVCLCVLANTAFPRNFHIYNYSMDFY